MFNNEKKNRLNQGALPTLYLGEDTSFIKTEEVKIEDDPWTCDVPPLRHAGIENPYDESQPEVGKEIFTTNFPSGVSNVFVQQYGVPQQKAGDSRDVNNCDTHLSNSAHLPSGSVYSSFYQTYPILSNLLQPVDATTSETTNEAVHIAQNQYFNVTRVDQDHNYVKKVEPGETPKGDTFLTVNLTKYAKNVNIKDIQGVVLLLKNSASPITINNITIHDPNVPVQGNTATVTEPPIQNIVQQVALSETAEAQSKDEFHHCEFCDLRFHTRLSLKNHVYRYHSESTKEFKCPSCWKCYATRKGVNKHVRMEHFFNCDYCKESYEKAGAYKKHLKEVHTEVNYRLCKPLYCEDCDKEITGKNEFIKHLRTHGGIICGICAERFSTKDEYNVHATIHPNQYSCTKCDKSFKLKVSLQAHQAVHNDPLQFVCKECNKGYKTKSTLRHHMFTHFPKHTAMCEKCSKTFRSKSALFKHQQDVHGSKDHKCPHCDKRFTLSYLKVHINITHLKLTPYQCEYCGKRFARKDYVINHMKTHHKSENQVIVKRRRQRNLLRYYPKVQGPPVNCPICKKRLKSAEYLKQHIKSIHARIRNFKCKFCGLMFLHQTTKIRHEAAHEADPELKFVCPVCWKKVKTQEELDAHTLEHNNRPKRHVCDVCGEKFARKMLLENHIFSEHTSKEEILEKEKVALDAYQQALMMTEQEQSVETSVNDISDK